MKSIIVPAFVSIFLALTSNAAHAQGASFGADVIEVSRKAWNAASSAASSLWDYVTPSRPSGLLSKSIMDYDQEEDLGFKALMKAGGFSIKRVESGIGVVPHLAIKYGRSIELAEHDILYVHRLLRKHARLHRGPLSRLHREIVTAVVELQAMKSFTLESVEIDLLPLPKVQFVSVPSNAPLGEEASRLMRAIQRLNETLSN
jgi:hypothetical protein